MDMKNCIWCKEALEGRVDKKYCSPYCRTAFHNQKAKETGVSTLLSKIDNQLKQNRRILKEYNKAGKATVVQQVLLKEGFSPKYFTHYWRAKNRNLYFFCYEYGFMEKDENGKKKYVLIKWQPFMER